MRDPECDASQTPVPNCVDLFRNALVMIKILVGGATCGHVKTSCIAKNEQRGRWIMLYLLLSSYLRFAWEQSTSCSGEQTRFNGG